MTKTIHHSHLIDNNSACDSCIEKYSQGLYIFHIIPNNTPEFIDSLYDLFLRMIEPNERIFIIVNMPKNPILKADARKRLKERFSAISKRVEYLIGVYDGNIVIKILFLFISQMTGYKSYSLYFSLEEAIEEMKAKAQTS
jgi:hypothetical protein